MTIAANALQCRRVHCAFFAFFTIVLAGLSLATAAIADSGVDLSAAECTATVRRDDVTVKALEAERDRAANARKQLTVLGAVLSALSSGIAVFMTKARNRQVTAGIASVCGALTAVAALYDQSDDEKKRSSDAKSTLEERRSHLVAGNDDLINTVGVSVSATIDCWRRLAGQHFAHCVYKPSDQVPPRICDDETPKQQATVPASTASGTPSEGHPPAGTATVHAAHPVVTSPGGPCSDAVRAALGNLTPTIKAKLPTNLPHGIIGVRVRFGENRGVNSVDAVAGDSRALDTVQLVLKPSAKGEANCETTMEYRW